LPGGQSDRPVVVLIPLPGAVGRGAKGPGCPWLFCFVSQRGWEERHGGAEAGGQAEDGVRGTGDGHEQAARRRARAEVGGIHTPE
jgi:hypothetical protein